MRDQAFGARITFDLPGVAERAMYFGADPLWLGGHASAGATAPASDWFLAEGATGTYFTTFLLIANPNDEAADVTVRYLPEAGDGVTKTYRIEGGPATDAQHRARGSRARRGVNERQRT